jgi:hypothetical protein
MPATLPKKDPASYEKLLGAYPNAPTPRPWIAKVPQSLPRQSNTVTRLGVSAGRRGTTTLKPSSSLYPLPATSITDARKWRCKSCDSALNLDNRTAHIDNTQHMATTYPKTSVPLSVAPQALLKEKTDPRRLPTTSGSSTPSEDGKTHGRSAGALNRAVTGLENLLEEALNVARDAARAGKPEQVAGVLNDATLALRKASVVQARMSRPLRLSFPEPSGSSISDGDISPIASARTSRQPSAETALTNYTRSRHPSVETIAGAQVAARRDRGRRRN